MQPKDPDEVDHLLSRLEPRQAVELLVAERDRSDAKAERYREFVVDLAEGWVGDAQNRARAVLWGGR